MIETPASPSQPSQPAPRPRHVHIWLSILAALIAIAGSVVGLTQSSVYADLTPAFFPQALAQDVANLAVASPAMLILAALGLRGSLRAHLLWLGVLAWLMSSVRRSGSLGASWSAR